MRAKVIKSVLTSTDVNIELVITKPPISKIGSAEIEMCKFAAIQQGF